MSTVRDVSREAFAALPVFEQDFENALQMLMFQDQKLVQFSLENAQPKMNQRAKRFTYEQVDAASFCSDRRKRQCVGAPNMKYKESEGGFEMVDTQLTALCGDVAHQMGTNDRQEARDDSLGCEVTLVSDGVPPKSCMVWGDRCIETTRGRVGWVKSRLDGGDKYEQLYRDEKSVCSKSTTADTATIMDDLDAVPSLFSTGLGKTVLVSKARLRACEEKLNSEGESARNGKTNVATATTMDDSDAVPSLFSTGSGKTVLVSKSRLRACEEKLQSEEVWASNGKASVAAATTMDDSDAVPSLFSTGSGKTVLVSKSRLRECEEKLNGEEELACNDKADAAATTTMGISIKGSRSGWKKIANGGDQAGDLDLPLNSQPNMSCGSSSIGVKSSGAGRNRNASTALGRARKTLHDHANSHSQGLNYGDKENIHPKDVRILRAAASKPCKAWRSTLDKNQLSARPTAKYCERQCLRQQKMSRRLLRPFVELRSGAVGKNRFHPPVPSKRSSTCHSESREGFGRLAVSRAEKQKEIAFDVQHFVYQEVTKISLSSLMTLYKGCTLAEADSGLYRRQILDTITAENAVDVRFTGNNGLVCSSNNNVDDGQSIGPRELYRQLRARKHISKKMGATFAWFLNHYRWVVWKMAATERSFPRLLLGKYLTKDQVIRQIVYRYQHDVADAKRSILKKILNRDASSLSCVVLCIAAVLPYPADLQNDPIDQECPACFNLALVLTDGWYSVYAVPDAPLAAVLWNLHAKSSIIGTKIAAWNALLQNSVEGIDPLECAIVCESQWKHPLAAREDITRWPYLRLRYNSTRRVRFDTQLGVERLQHAVSSNSRQYKQQPQLQFSLLKSVPLKCLEVGGGMVRSVRVRVTRISPVLHLQANDWTAGPRILCDDQLPLYFQLRSEYARAAMLKKRKQDDVDIVENDWLDHDQDNTPPPVPFIKVDVECTHTCANYHRGSGYGILTIWRPSEELLCGGIQEGVEYFVDKLNVRWKLDGGRSHDAYVQLSSTKHSTFEEVCSKISSSGDEKKSDAKLKRGERVCVDIRQATDRYRSTLEDGLSGYGNDWRPKVDVCVYVVLVTAPVTQDDSTSAAKRHKEASLLDPVIKPVESRYVQHAFVTDQSCRLMSIRVTGTNVSVLRHNSPSKCASSSSFVFCRGNKNVWKEGSIICLSGLEISHYDEHLDVLDCILAESTQIVSSPSKRSLFWERFSLLECEAGISAKHFFAAQAVPSFGSFAEKFALLKKHVERDILGMDLAPSRNCDEHYATLVEQKRHGRDRWPQEGGADATGTARTDQALSKSSRLSWKARVTTITLLTGNRKLMFPSGVIASACVNVGTDDIAYRTVYLTRKVLFSMEALLLQAGTFCREGDGVIETKHEDTVLVNTVYKVLRQPEMNYVFRFEVSRIKNERLAGSWKPWEHLHALYWLVETVIAG